MNKELLRKYREDLAGLSLRQAAKIGPCTAQYISAMEMGTRNNPKASLLRKLVEVYRGAYAQHLIKKTYGENAQGPLTEEKYPAEFNKAWAEITIQRLF